MISEHIWGCHDNVNLRQVVFYEKVFETHLNPPPTLLRDTQGIQLNPRLHSEEGRFCPIRGLGFTSLVHLFIFFFFIYSRSNATSQSKHTNSTEWLQSTCIDQPLISALF